jgi:D-3-phosphoglycerate dehydrogenase / 2-oxoglutarate reductase
MILITADTHPYLLEALEKRGLQYKYEPNIDLQGLEKIITDLTGLVVTTKLKIDKALLDKADKLKWIGRLGSGMELIDAKYAMQKNIACISTPEGNCNAVGEHCLGLLLNIMRNIHYSATQVKNYIWQRNENRGEELSGKTIGIIGFGHTGQAFAKVLAGFGCTILAYDKYKHDFGNAQVRETSLEQICRYADVVSFHVPLGEETKHIANDSFFAQLQLQPILLNSSRGNVVHTKSLIVALKNKQISGAGLDVLENEKLNTISDEEKEDLAHLQSFKNVVITPHIAGYSNQAYYKMAAILIEKLEKQALI